jgi:Ca2+-transporting ATPase
MLETMDDEELSAQLKNVGVFARILPEQKLRIVQALKAQGEIVGMTGDGVNDAPSLKAADIGIAMGGRGTDVAREAASIVLLDDDFGSIVAAVRMGRRIYDNLSKAMGFIVAVHVPIAGLALVPLLFGLPILLGPVHMALLEMIIDPTCSLAFEAEREEQDIMRRSPRDARARLLSVDLLVRSVLEGAVALVTVGLVLAVLVSQGASPTELRSTVFVALVLGVLALVLVNRSFSASLASAIMRPNPALATVVIIVFLMLGLAELVPAIGEMLKFTVLDMPQALIALGAGTCVLLILEMIKRAWPGYPNLADRKLGESRNCTP